MAALRRVLVLGQVYVPTMPTFIAILIPPSQVGHVVAQNTKILVRRVRHTPVNPRGVLVLLQKRGVGVSVPDRYAAHMSFCLYYDFKMPRFVATFEEEMMMQEEGMITADQYSIDCNTCGHGKCV
jgi:hypothetical protein